MILTAAIHFLMTGIISNNVSLANFVIVQTLSGILTYGKTAMASLDDRILRDYYCIYDLSLIKISLYGISWKNKTTYLVMGFWCNSQSTAWETNIPGQSALV